MQDLRAQTNAPGTGSQNWYYQFYPTVPEAGQTCGHAQLDTVPLRSRRDRTWNPQNEGPSRALFAAAPCPEAQFNMMTNPPPPGPQRAPNVTGPPRFHPNPYFPVRALYQNEAHCVFER